MGTAAKPVQTRGPATREELACIAAPGSSAEIADARGDGRRGVHRVGGQVDHALGYTHNDLGPVRSHRPRIESTRVQALAISTVTMGVMSLLMGTLVLLGAVAVMGMDASHLPLLWLFSV